MRLYGLVGKARAGKDTLVSIVQDNTDEVVVRHAFADALKDEVAAALGCSANHIENHKEVFRPILQWWGTEWRRAADADHWIKRLAARLPWSHDVVVFIPDVRFDNEWTFIRRLGGQILRVIREDGVTTPHTDHVTESGLTAQIEQARFYNRTLPEFEEQVKAWWATQKPT